MDTSLDFEIFYIKALICNYIIQTKFTKLQIKVLARRCHSKRLQRVLKQKPLGDFMRLLLLRGVDLPNSRSVIPNFLRKCYSMKILEALLLRGTARVLPIVTLNSTTWHTLSTPKCKRVAASEKHGAPSNNGSNV